LTEINTIEKLPKNFTDYIHFLERELDTPIKIISVGPDRKQTILR
jgi:adenylosuccinate synthase